ncbi:MAG: U32 family peptidase [Proteobacteria bacterium]|nr:U32 family peptidase [Pseudomonadota bacterium]MBU1058435.1 U32 family peptidase [Pseudomonadota bacterium]
MGRKIELLAPGGDIDSIKAAIIAGANAIYCGLDRFNARNRAENITLKDLSGIIRLAHKHDCQVFLTLNIIIVESEIPALIRLLNRLINTNIDAVIVQDLGVFYLLSHYFPGLAIHASTQLTTHNAGQIKFLSKLTATRVNLSRELSLHEIKELAITGHEHNVLIEVFVHGSYCLSFSGICYMSSVNGGNSGNRGRCSQLCRDQYVTTAQGRNFPLNIKDNSAYFDLRELFDAGVDSIKIEGRIKKFHYVYTVVNSWKKQIQSLYDQGKVNCDNSDLYKVFNRDFSNAFLKGDINKSMFIDNPRDNAAIHLSEIKGFPSDENLEKYKKEIYDVKTGIIKSVEGRIKKLSIEKAPLIITVTGEPGTPLQVSVKTPDASFVVLSDINLVTRDTCSGGTGNSGKNRKNRKNSAQCLDYEMFLERMKSLNDTEYFITRLELEDIQSNLFMPFKEITAIKKRILFILNGSKGAVDPVAVPLLTKQSEIENKPALSVLISSQKDLHLCHTTSADIYFQLPDSFKNACSEFIDLFRENKRLIPWFPSVLIGEDYHAALEFLQQGQPKRIVTNNSGIAYEAYRKGIPWIAGPYLNSVNSFSLLSLKENFNCYGAFISNELKKMQIKSIKRPRDFELYYSIYHPIVLLTSRQCLFHQVTGCEKNSIDDTCMQQCEKYASITNLKDVSFGIEKTKGNYPGLYSKTNFLNTDIVTDIPGLFSGFSIDLREIKTDTKIELDKSRIVTLFENHLDGISDATEELKKNIHPVTNTQYIKGI